MERQQKEDVVFDQLQKIIADALRVKPERITLQARLFNDLGAESLDILDIRFQIERAFGFKIEQDEIAREVGARFTAEEMKTQLTVERLKEFVLRRLRERSSVA